MALILTLAFAADAQAYSSYMSRIPNTPNSCNTCHSYGGGSPRNAFGLAFDSNGLVWTDALANADSDSDGQSNGEELGDPCGIWSQGETPARSNDLSKPGDVGSTSADGMAGRQHAARRGARRCAVRLPDQPDNYDQFVERQRSLALEQADYLNRKKNQDIEVGDERIILKSPNGTRFKLVVNDLGVVTASAV